MKHRNCAGRKWECHNDLFEFLQRQFNIILVTVYQEHTGIHSSVSITFIYLLLSIRTVKEDLMWLPPAYNTSEESGIMALMVIEQKCCIHRPQGHFPNCLNYRCIPQLSFILSLPASPNVDLVTGKQLEMIWEQHKGKKHFCIALPQPFSLVEARIHLWLSSI